MIDGPLVNSGKDTIVTIELNVLASCCAACIRSCQNGGTLDGGTCVCDCSGGFSGNNCESERSFVMYTFVLVAMSDICIITIRSF